MANTQEPIHVFAGDSLCSGLKTLALLTRWDKAPLVSPDAWKIVFRAFSSDGHVMYLDFTTCPPLPHTTSQKLFDSTGKVLQTQTITLPPILSGHDLTHDIATNEWIDFYSDGDSGQMFWYGPGAAFQAFSHNFQNFVVKNLVWTDCTATIEQMNPADTLTFTQLSTSITELGQIANNSANGTPIVVQFLQEPAAPNCSGLSVSVPNTNVRFINATLVPNKNFGGIATSVQAKISL